MQLVTSKVIVLCFLFSLTPAIYGCGEIDGAGTCPVGYEREVEGACVAAPAWNEAWLADVRSGLDGRDGGGLHDGGADVANELSGAPDPCAGHEPDEGLRARIGGILPNPVGSDGGLERVTLYFERTHTDATKANQPEHETIERLERSLRHLTLSFFTADTGPEVGDGGYDDAYEVLSLSEALDDGLVAFAGDEAPADTSETLNLIAEITIPCATTAGCLRNAAGYAALSGCDAPASDTLAYPELGSGVSFARCMEPTSPDWGGFGARDANGAFVTSGFCAAACDASKLDAFELSALLINPDGPDDGAEWVLISGPPSTRVEGLYVQGVDGLRGTTWLNRVALSGETDVDGHFLLGGRLVEGADLASLATLQNGPDVLVLGACDGAASQSIAWGDVDPSLFPAPDVSVSLPASGSYLARCPDGWREAPSPASGFVGERERMTQLCGELP